MNYSNKPPKKAGDHKKTKRGTKLMKRLKPLKSPPTDPDSPEYILYNL